MTTQLPPDDLCHCPCNHDPAKGTCADCGDVCGNYGNCTVCRPCEKDHATEVKQ